MTQYMIIRGPISFKKREGNPVAITSKNGVLEIVGEAKPVDYWSKIMAQSLILAQSFKRDELLLDSFASANSMVDIIVFDNKNYDDFKEEFEAITGKRRVVKITRVPDRGDDDYSESKVNEFMRRRRKIK